jgi:hypothetical protein
MSSTFRSYSSDQRREPVAASISRTVTRSRFSSRRTLPWSTVWTPRVSPIARASSRPSRSAKEEVGAATCRPSIWLSAAMICSLRPSLK